MEQHGHLEEALEGRFGRLVPEQSLREPRTRPSTKQGKQVQAPLADTPPLPSGSPLVVAVQAQCQRARADVIGKEPAWIQRQGQGLGWLRCTVSRSCMTSGPSVTAILPRFVCNCAIVVAPMRTLVVKRCCLTKASAILAISRP